MVFVKILLFASLVATSLAYPRPQEAQSYSSFSAGPISSEGGIAVAASPLSISHAPALLVHKPVVIHKPVLHHHHVPEVEHYEPAHYEFKYGVHDGHTHDIKEQAEKRVGDKVEGHYSLLEPDGTTRTVKYSADKHTGFHAIVTKSGHAIHPTHGHKVALPVHKVALPVHKVVSSPIISYSAPAPLLSIPAASSSSPGGATSYSSFSS